MQIYGVSWFIWLYVGASRSQNNTRTLTLDLCRWKMMVVSHILHYHNHWRWGSKQFCWRPVGERRVVVRHFMLHFISTCLMLPHSTSNIGHRYKGKYQVRGQKSFTWRKTVTNRRIELLTFRFGIWRATNCASRPCPPNKSRISIVLSYNDYRVSMEGCSVYIILSILYCSLFKRIISGHVHTLPLPL